MASNPRAVIVQPTRSMTRAAESNLQIGGAQDDAGKLVEPSIIEPEREDGHDCAGCTRPNKVELYMVRCEKCEQYFHLSFGNVSAATVNQPPFVCPTCVPLRPRSVRSSGSHASSISSALIAMELQQMEEQHRILEAIMKEKIVQLERQHLYRSKKNALLRQLEEEDEKREVHSSDSRASTSRVEVWIKSQTEAENISPGINHEMTESGNHIQPLIEASAANLRVELTFSKLTSTNASSNAMSNDSSDVSAQPPASLEANSEKEVDVPKVPDPTPAESHFIELPKHLGKPNTGAIQKILKVTSNAFEERRSSSKRKDLEQMPAHLNDETKKSEQHLLVLQQFQRQREEQGRREGDDETREATKPTDRPSSNIKMCPMCDNSGHLVANCSKFSKPCLDDRWKLVKEKRLCRRCMVAHSRWPCKSDPCGVQGCQKKHHPLLHYEQAPTEAKRSEPATSGVVALHRQPTISTLFRMLPVTLYGKKGKVNTFAFLEYGSSVTLLERKLAATLGLEGKQASLCIHWTSGIKRNFSETREVELEISGADRPQRFVASNVYTVDKLGLPEQTMDVAAMEEEFAYLQDLPLSSLQSAVPGILIGLNNVHLLATLKLREGRKGELIGSMPATTQSFAHRQYHISDEQAKVDLHEYVKSFFAVECLGVMAVPSEESVDDQRANKILSETTKRVEGGRFETGLLWKQDYVEFPDSRPMAEKRMKCLERRLGRDPALYDQVRKQIADFQSKGFAHKATAAELDTFDPRRTWYLPLGVVLNPKKPSKVRVIWDAAAKVVGVSLNTMLLKGPDLLTPLLSVHFQFREIQVAICADIEAMFHQVKIREPDRSAQLFLCRDSPDKPLETMVTDVAIFEAACSPAHSQYVKNLNADEHEADQPKAAAAIRNKHYVDDYLDSVDTADEAVAMALEVAEVHAKAGFHIRNWISNDKTVLARNGAVNPTTVKNFVIEKENGFERLLGMVWLPDEDMFSFALRMREDNMKLLTGEVVPTKTQLLSIVMSIYDPNGLVAVFVIHGKILVQDVWRSGVGWKDKIPEKLIGRWKQWIALLRKTETVVFWSEPRRYCSGSGQPTSAYFARMWRSGSTRSCHCPRPPSGDTVHRAWTSPTKLRSGAKRDQLSTPTRKFTSALSSFTIRKKTGPKTASSGLMFSHFVVKPIIRLELFSRWERLLRMVAYVHRFLARRLKLKQETCPGALTREELQKAERSLWRLAQSDAYPDEVATLNQNLLVQAESWECLQTSSSILKLFPLLDDCGVLRAGSRLEGADLVLVEDKGHRNGWLRGLVARTYPGKDGRVRRADVQTTKGLLRERAVVKLALLDFGDAEDSGADHHATRGGGCCEHTVPTALIELIVSLVPSAKRN